MKSAESFFGMININIYIYILNEGKGKKKLAPFVTIPRYTVA